MDCVTPSIFHSYSKETLSPSISVLAIALQVKVSLVFGEEGVMEVLLRLGAVFSTVMDRVSLSVELKESVVEAVQEMISLRIALLSSS